MADLRILQANERTFLAWTRTGIALVVFGFALARVAVWLEPIPHHSGGVPTPPSNDGPLIALGILLVVVGSLIPPIAAYRHAKIRRAILADLPIHPSASPAYALGGLLAAVGLALALWLALT